MVVTRLTCARSACAWRSASSACLRFGDIVVGFQDRKRPLSLVAQQRPSARHYDLGSISLGVYELAFPPAGTQQLRVNLYQAVPGRPSSAVGE